MMRTPLRILLVLTSQATMGDELLNREWFRSRTEAKVLIERWRQFYNEQRPHSAHAYKPPATIRRNWINPIASLRTHCLTGYKVRTQVTLAQALKVEPPGMGAPTALRALARTLPRRRQARHIATRERR